MGQCGCAGWFGASPARANQPRFSMMKHTSAEHLGHSAIVGRYHRMRRLEDDYEVTKVVLGKGYNGEVHVGMDKRSGRKVAVKSFSLRGVGKDKLEELTSECGVFLSLDHPHVARLLNVYESSESLELVTECLEGGELLEKVKRTRVFSESDAAEAARQMLESIQYLHSRDPPIVHRDIKLENFLYETTDKEYLKLIDFGFSYRYQEGEKMEVQCGTMSYVAPEIVKGGGYGIEVDMWSFGIVVFVLLCGYLPFPARGVNRSDLAKKIMEGNFEKRPERWKRVSSLGQQFVDALLVIDPKQRMTAKAALDHDWIQMSSGAKNSLRRTESVDMDAAESLIHFAEADVCRRACMSMMAWSLTKEERREVRHMFSEMDTDKSGTISLSEFETGMRKLKAHKSKSSTELEKIFKGVDPHNGHEINYSEFLSAMCCKRITMNERLLHDAFNRFDENGNDFIEKSELERVLGKTVGDEEFNAMQSHREGGDIDKRGIDFVSFKRYLLDESCSEEFREASLARIDQMIDQEGEPPGR